MNTRTELELTVRSMNKYLKSEVHKMDYLELLCNVHSLYRGDFALRLFREGKITREQAGKFIKLVGHG